LSGGGSGGTGSLCGSTDEVGGAGGGGGGGNFTAASATGVTIGTSSRAFGSDGQVTISYAGTAPVITSPASGSVLPAATVGQSYSTTITATGIPAPTFTATGLPPGLSIGADSGVISGIPTTTGTYTPAVTATSAAGTDTATYTLPVVNTGPARADLAISMTAPTTLPPGGTGTIIVTVINKGPQTATGVLTLLSVPSGLTITSAGGGTVHHGVDLFTAPTLAAGHKLIYTVQVKAGTTRARVLLIASTGSATRDPNLFNNITAAFLSIT
jgi:hypothetical protein